MLSFGASTFIWVSPFSTQYLDLVSKVKAMGFDILEVAVEQIALIDWPTLKALADENGLKITISGAFGPNRDISSDNPAVREEGLAYINDCLKIAADMLSLIHI